MGVEIERDSAGYPRIVTARLTLKTLSSVDAAALLKYRAEGEVLRFQHFHPTSIDDALSFIARATQYFNVENSWHQFGVFFEKRLIGDIGVHFLGQNGKTCEIGYTVDPNYQRRGYASEAVRGMLEYLFDQLEKEHVFAVVDPRNTASIGLLRKLGCSEFSPRPRNLVTSKNLDVPAFSNQEICYALSREEWRAQNRGVYNNRCDIRIDAGGSMKEVIQYFAKCNAIENREMLAVIEKSTPDPLAAPLTGYFFKTLGQLLEHVYLGDRHLVRMFLDIDTYGHDIDAESGALIEGSQPLFKNFKEFLEHRQKMDDFLIVYADSIQEADLFKTASRINRRGEKQEKVAWKAWLHVFNHQTHHRGQISNILDTMQIENNYSNLITIE